MRKECRDSGVRLKSQWGDERGVADEIGEFVLSAYLKSDDFYERHEAMLLCKDWAVGSIAEEKKPDRSHLRVLKSPS